MRTHGWNGAVPDTDEEAVARILDAVRVLSTTAGDRPTVAAVARRLGITRQTVYRYFADLEQLLLAAARQEASSFVELLMSRLDGLPTASDVVGEALAFVIEELPRQRLIAAATIDVGASTTMSVLQSANARHHIHDVAERAGIRWDHYGVRDDEVEDFVDHLLRTIHSFLLCPSRPDWSSVQLRNHLSRWVTHVGAPVANG